MHALVRAWQLAALCLACLVALVCASGSYDITNARLSVQSFDGAPRLSEKFASKASVQPALLAAEPDDVIKFAFTIADGQGEAVKEDLVPHQAWVVLSDTTAQGAAHSAVWPVRVRGSSASATWSLRMDKLHASVKQKLVDAGPNHPFQLSLLLGSFAPDAASALDAAVIPFLQLEFSASLLARFPAEKPSQRSVAEAKDGFVPWPEHFHTFATEPWQTMPPKAVSLAAALAVFLGPWALLACFWGKLAKRLQAPSVADATLLASIYALEVLALFHWVGTPFYIVCPAALGLAGAALVGGRQALTRPLVS